MNRKTTFLGAVATLGVFTAGAFDVEQVMRAPRYTRGDTNVRKVQPIDRADWIWFPGCATDTAFVGNPRTFRFRRAFTSDGSPLTFDVSADERYVLILDGRVIGRGPDRAATVENWMYNSYRVKDLAAGNHLMEAVCWTHWGQGPLAQITYRGGFVLKAEGAYDAALSTRNVEGKAQGIDIVVADELGKEKEVLSSGWEAGEITSGWKLYNGGPSAWGCGLELDLEGCGFLEMQPEKWVAAEVVAKGAGADSKYIWGGRNWGWMLFPTQLPAQLDRRIAPGRFVAGMDKVSTEADLYVQDGTRHPAVAKLNAVLKDGKTWTVPANTEASACWYLGDYYGAYPHLVVSGGKGAVVRWGWAESLYTKEGEKNVRSQFVDKRFIGTFDTFRPDGRKRARFNVQWWRCGCWCELKIKTAAEPMTIEEIAIDETRYPLEPECAFSCDDQTFGPIQKICTRVMQSCCHEMLFDGPFYEQQMYPGDTRVQLLSLSAISRDDRMIRRAIEVFDFGQRDDGQVPFNAPTQGTQEGATYTQCWLLMHGDYAMYHDNFDWLKARVPAMRKALSGFELYENEAGLLASLPGWNFMDWDKNWTAGTAPGALPDEGPSALVNLFYVLDLQSAAKVERALGHEAMARAWEAKIPALKKAILEAFWDEETGMLLDVPAETKDGKTLKTRSEHAQVLGIVSGVLEGDRAKRAFDAMLAVKDDPKFARCTVYFSHYLFQACFLMNRADYVLKRLDLWRTYVAQGCATTIEHPEWKGHVSRSDCHAWGSHPLYWMQAGFAGVTPAKAAFAEVRVAPQPAGLTFIKAKVPHPKGFVEEDLAFGNGAAKGTVTLPAGVTGVFEFGGRKRALKPGENVID